MILSLKNIFISEGESEEFSANLDMSSVQTLLEKPVKEPVSVEGVLRNSAGVVTISYRVSTLLKANCARCFDEVRMPFSEEYEHTVVKDITSEEDEGDFILSENDELVLDDIVSSDLLLSLPSRFYCSDNCKGLCPVCGKNLNKGSCECVPEEDNISKKLSSLGDLLNK